MALGSTIYKVSLQVSDLDRHYYQEHALTVAQHPSETSLRMMVRLLAFALNAHDQLIFTKGLSTDDEPDLWQKDLTGDIDTWIDVGQPSLKRVKKACSQSKTVRIYTFSGHSAERWYQQNQAGFSALNKLQLINFPVNQLKGIDDHLSRSMTLQCTVQEGTLWFGNEQSSHEITPQIWQA